MSSPNNRDVVSENICSKAVVTQLFRLMCVLLHGVTIPNAF